MSSHESLTSFAGTGAVRLLLCTVASRCQPYFTRHVEQIGKCRKATPQALTVEVRIGRRNAENQAAPLVRERRLDDDAGPADGEHVRRPDRCTQYASAPQGALVHHALDAGRQLIRVAPAATDVPEI